MSFRNKFQLQVFFRDVFSSPTRLLFCHFTCSLPIPSIQKVRRKGPLWKNSAFAFESANHFLLSSVHGSTKSLSHVVDNFLLRQQRTSPERPVKKFDDAFMIEIESSRTFALLECGPGQLGSRYCIKNSQLMGSLSYSRLGTNWSECITRLKSGEFVVVIVYHQDDDQRTTVIVRKYRSSNVKCFVPSTVPMYHELKDLDPNLSVVAAEEFLATRVVVLRGNIGDCLISEVTEGFEHD